MWDKTKIILTELKAHAPFTLFGAFTGILCMFLFKRLEYSASHTVFYIFHPAHVVLSALVTTSMFRLHSQTRTFIVVVLVGFFGSVGIATVSDSLIPYAGELFLGMHVHTHIHEYSNFAEHAHIGFIEEWYIIVPAAIVGILIAYLRSKTKFPHAAHVLISTWASSFHVIMAMGGKLSSTQAIGMFIFLFLAVWLPCCFSDIVFPLLFVKPPRSGLEG